MRRIIMEALRIMVFNRRLNKVAINQTQEVSLGIILLGNLRAVPSLRHHPLLVQMLQSLVQNLNEATLR